MREEGGIAREGVVGPCCTVIFGIFSSSFLFFPEKLLSTYFKTK